MLVDYFGLGRKYKISKYVFKYKFIILGAGPSGLSFARRLQQLGEDSFIVLEKEQRAGGLCRSIKISDNFIDVGGGHFLDTKNLQVLNFLFEHLPKNNWKRYLRVSKIKLDENLIDYPIESNLWQLPIESQVKYLNSINKVGCINSVPEPHIFSEWIRWKLGDLIADTYLLPYNKKLWSYDLDELGTYWLDKLPNISFEQVLYSFTRKEACGEIPAHFEFYYPKEGGYGTVWEGIARHLNNKIIYNEEVVKIEENIVNGKYKGEIIINTIPWTIWPDICILPKEIKSCCRKLKYVSIDIEFIDKNYNTSNAHWIYIPDESISYHRVLLINNFSNGKGYWTESNCRRTINKNYSFFYRNEFAYPVPTIDKPDNINRILNWAKRHNIIGLGRWGEWEHFNSDVCVQKAINLAEYFIEEGKIK